MVIIYIYKNILFNIHELFFFKILFKLLLLPKFIIFFEINKKNTRVLFLTKNIYFFYFI